ncbi:hypothetical protein CRM22_003710 [Opisthorchis felineus]|uniref:BPTI/Kunitz inhibitor domain-containing protein n=1 Tax=Opisthorchis felineus TaxID=147828 RepID=A0A4S2LZZ2_OPIFE|nr:hypothetical protein CRM22_003710 [Opisthorchis felineus]TGZ69505.1 hypothetical protein CRM22_003710 [Opisthorchis felineus]
MNNSMQFYNFVSLLFCALTFAQAATLQGKSETQDVDKCSLPIEPGTGTASLSRFAFDGSQCVAFIYSGLGGNANRFPIIQECEAECENK